MKRHNANSTREESTAAADVYKGQAVIRIAQDGNADPDRSSEEKGCEEKYKAAQEFPEHQFDGSYWHGGDEFDGSLPVFVGERAHGEEGGIEG